MGCLLSSVLMPSNACHTLERKIQNSAIRADLLVFIRHILVLCCRKPGHIKTVLFSIPMSKTFPYFYSQPHVSLSLLLAIPSLMLLLGCAWLLMVLDISIRNAGEDESPCSCELPEQR